MPCTVCNDRHAEPRDLRIAGHTLITPLCGHCAELLGSTLADLRAWRDRHGAIGAQGPARDTTGREEVPP